MDNSEPNPPRPGKRLGTILLVAAFVGLVVGVAGHIWLFNYLEAANCKGFWLPKSPGEPNWNKSWPTYCYWNRARPGEYAGTAGVMLWAGMVLATGTVRAMFVIPQWYRHPQSRWGIAVSALLTCALLWVWYSQFRTATF